MGRKAISNHNHAFFVFSYTERERQRERDFSEAVGRDRKCLKENQKVEKMLCESHRFVVF